jgi:mono/diheme cytochrome c family protein
MERTFYPTLLIVMFFLVINCARSAGPIPAAGYASTGKTEEVDFTAIQRGRALAVTECTQCHRLYRPDEFLVERWPHIIQTMGRRSSLNEKQINDIVIYYTSGTK